MKEFTTTREETDATEDASISQALLDLAQESVEVMQKEVMGLRDRLQRASQEAKAKRIPLEVARGRATSKC